MRIILLPIKHLHLIFAVQKPIKSINMKTILQNIKNKLMITGIIIISMTTGKAQVCGINTSLYYNGNGSLTAISQGSASPAGWVSYVTVDFGNGNVSSTADSSNFWYNQNNYTQNGTYVISTTYWTYNPADSIQSCSAIDYDTLVVNDYTGGGPANPCSLTVSVGAYSTTSVYDVHIYSFASGSFTSSQLVVDGTTYPNTDSLNLTFSQPGVYPIYYYAQDSSANGFCWDTAVFYYTVPGPTPSCQASFYLWQDSTVVGAWYGVNNSVGVQPLTYNWNFGDGTTSTQAYPIHNYNTPGNYVICLTIADANGCTSSACDSSAAFRMFQSALSTNAIIGSLSISAPTGITENISSVLSTKTYPNPMADITTVSFNSTQSLNGIITITNILGDVILSQEVIIAKGNNNIKLETNNINTGVYFISINAENKSSSTIKVVK